MRWYRARHTTMWCGRRTRQDSKALIPTRPVPPSRLRDRISVIMAEAEEFQHQSVEQELDNISTTLGGHRNQQPVQAELLEIILSLAKIVANQEAEMLAVKSGFASVNTQLASITTTLDQILKAVQSAPQTSKIEIHFGSQKTGENNMALSLPVGQTDKYYINALDASGDPGATLAAGQVLAVVSASPTVVLTPDATPAIDPKTNVQSVASGSVSIGASPVIG